MSGLLIKIFIPKDGDKARLHMRCGVLSGVVGIILNILLVIAKLAIGIICGSVAIIADGVNNLSDAASSVVTLTGFKLAAQKPDKEHPFGHGRIEYVTGLIISALIIFMAFELGYTSVEKIISPSATTFSYVATGILCAAVLVKLWLFYFNRKLARLISSAALKATAADSLYDVAATCVTIAALVAGMYTDFPIDGVAGLIVALFILKAGVSAIKSTQAPLLGRPMPKELAEKIDSLALEHENILGVHDLVYHDYGPANALLTFHAEVPPDISLIEAHTLIDHIEREIKEKFGITAVIHPDPTVKDGETDVLRQLIKKAALSIDSRIDVHDLQIKPADGGKEVYFDITIPYDLKMSGDEVKKQITEIISAQKPDLKLFITAEYPLVES